jgi:DNA polymerase-1
MVSKQERYLVDVRFIVQRTHDSFIGAPLLTVDGKDYTFIFGFARDLLRLRQSLGLETVVLVIGKDARSIMLDQNIDDIITFLDEMEFPYLDDPSNTTLRIVNYLCPQFSHIITADERFLQLSRDDLTIVLCDERSGPPKYFSPESIKTELGVNPAEIPTYLALTAGAKTKALTHRQAIQLIEVYGVVDAIYENLEKISSSATRRKLVDSEHEVKQYYSESTVDEHVESMSYHITNTIGKLKTERSRQILEKYGFYSLLALLSTPPNISTPPNMQLASAGSNRQSESYTAVINRKTMKELEDRIKSAEVCSIDTESDDKDPRSGTLLGVSFCLREGNAYFVPLTERYLEDLNTEDVLRFLNRVLHSDVDIIGHNLKYDYILLNKSGVKIRSTHFDTMLAAYDCYGDSEFFNLKHLAHTLLGRQIKAYRDLVDQDSTFLDLPFDDMVHHACQDADMTFRLYAVLLDELKKRNLEQQYFTDSMSHLKRVSDLEIDGVSVDEQKLDKIRDLLLKEAVRLKDKVSDKVGKVYDLDSQEDLSAILMEILDLRRFAGVKSISLQFLEQVAITEPIVRLIVHYKRVRKQIKAIETISTSVVKGRVYPIFNLTQSPAGLITTSKPNLFDVEGLHELKSCFDESIQDYFHDTQRALDILADVTQDSVLKTVRGTTSKVDQFITEHPIMRVCDHDDLLLSLVIGYTDSHLSRRFLADHLTVATIRHDIEKRYSTLFKWIHDFQMNALRNGYATANGRRKYIDGLGSSNIAKRKRAQEHVVRWLIRL